MKKLFLIPLLFLAFTANAAQLQVTVGSSGDRQSIDTNFTNIQSNFTELYSSSGTTELDALTDVTGDGTADNVLYDDGDGTFSFRAAPSGSFSWPASDSNYYGAYNGAWTSLTGVLAGKVNVTNSAFTAGALSDLKIATTAQPTTGEPIVDDTVSYGDTEDNLRVWSIQQIGAELADKVDKATFPETLCVAASDESTDLTTGTAKVTFRMPWALTLTAVRASVNTAPVGSTLNVDINEGGTSVLSTVITVDASEETSTTAATAAVISDSVIADDAEITIDIDQVGSTTAGAGLKVCLYGTRSI